MAEMKRLWAELSPSERREHRYGGPGAIGAAAQEKEAPPPEFGVAGLPRVPGVSFGNEGDEEDG